VQPTERDFEKRSGQVQPFKQLHKTRDAGEIKLKSDAVNLYDAIDSLYKLSSVDMNYDERHSFCSLFTKSCIPN